MVGLDLPYDIALNGVVVAIRLSVVPEPYGQKSSKELMLFPSGISCFGSQSIKRMNCYDYTIYSEKVSVGIRCASCH